MTDNGHTIEEAICDAPYKAWRHLYRARIVDGVIGSRCAYCGAPGHLPVKVYLFCLKCGCVLSSAVSQMQGICGMCYHPHLECTFRFLHRKDLNWRRRVRNRRHQATYREVHGERLLAYRRAWRKANPERAREWNRKYNETHQEQIREKGRKYRETHREEIRAKARKRYQDRKEEELNLPIEV